MAIATKTVQWYLENFSFFDVLTKEDRMKLGKLALMERLPEGQVIYTSGQTADSLYLVKEGKVRILQRSDSGKEIILAVLGPGEVFGELSVAGKEIREEIAVVGEEALICRFEIDAFGKVVEDNPALLLQITKTIGQRLEKLQRHLERLMFRTAEERVRDFIRDLVFEHGYVVGNNPNEMAVHVQLTHDEIGKMTATSRQTVTTVLSNLEKSEIITYNRHRIYIKCLNKL
ncbi:Crp/Fnr family transcriptional regulator [Pontibacter locisalis]|uniref:Crp/Fnr family transcriptional regulator n=1 Tax=Pontibacter locisalis TaxID=1719035 RepID=A0ABW5IS60_9BACT